MKKLIILLLSLLSLNVSNAQFELDEILLRNRISTITNFPVEWDNDHGHGRLFMTFLMNNTLSTINIEGKYCRWMNSTNNGSELCCAKKYEDAYMEIEPHYGLVPATTVMTQVEGQEFAFEIYKRIYQGLENDPNFYQIIRFEYDEDIVIRDIPQPMNIQKIRIWYRKIVEWDCNFMGM